MQARPTASIFQRFITPALCVSAGFLAATLVMFPAESDARQAVKALAATANAGMVGQAGAYTVLTNDVGNEELLVVLDGRSEELFVYRTDIREGMQLYQRVNLPRMFVDAKLRAQGRN